MVLLVQGRLDVVPSRLELNPEGIPVVGSAVAEIDFLVGHARSCLLYTSDAADE